jgi:hypothetical protein
VSPDGSSQTFDSDVGSSHTIEDGEGSYSIVATLEDGSEETIRTITSSDDSFSGTVSYNSPVEGVLVESYDLEGNLVDSDLTNANGVYNVKEADELRVNGFTASYGDVDLNTVASNEGTSVPSILMNGDGSSSSPYEISTASELQAMQEDRIANYIVVNDIDASGTVNWNEKTSDEFKSYSLSNGDTTELNYVASEGTINVVDESGVDVTFTTNAGNDSITIDDTDYDSNYKDFTISYDLETPYNQGFNPVGTYDFEQANSEFTGSFDGQNHTISNLSINRVDYVGLFGTIGSSAEVENVGVINVNMTGNTNVGGLVGENKGTVSNSYSTGNVTGEYNVGGLVGENDNDNGTVSNSYSTGNVTGEDWVGGLVGRNNYGTVSNSYSTGNVTGNQRVGGLLGYNDNGNISNSYSTGNVTGAGESYDVGGLVGKNNGDISNSYSTGNVTGDNNVGGLVGGGLFGSVSDSYWDTEATGQSSSGGGNVITTTSEMQGSSAEGNMNLDFTDTWSTVEGDYPELQWQE